MGQRLMASDEWYTPKWVFDDLDIIFDLDVASPIEGIDHVPARKRYTVNDNGLTSPWEGRVWMNPPYSKPTPWIDKFINHGNGIALLPMAKSRWYNNLMNSHLSFVLLDCNIKFDRPNKVKMNHMMGSTLWAISDENVEAISKLGRVR
jgi:hypothetical protein